MLCLIIAGSLFMGNTTGSDMFNVNQSLLLKKDGVQITIVGANKYTRELTLSEKYANVTLADTLKECQIQAYRTANGYD